MIFISYRRDESSAAAGRVHDRLLQEFGPDSVFIDVDSISLGADFVKAVQDAVAKSHVLLAVIGPGWLDARDRRGRRRIDDPKDFVRIEIATALQAGKLIVPILIDGAQIPKAGKLPDDLKELARRNGLDVRQASFHSDVSKLVRQLKRKFGQAVAKPARAPPKAVGRDRVAITQRDRKSKPARQARPEPDFSSQPLARCKAAAEAGNPGAMASLGDHYYEARNFDEAKRWYLKAADAGNVSAMIKLRDWGMLGLQKGLTRMVEDGLRWYERAAAAGDTKAMRVLGDAYKHGKGVAKNPAVSGAWYRKAATSGTE